MKNVKSIFYVLIATFAMIGCTKDDDPVIEETSEPSKVVSVNLGQVTNFTGACSKKFDFEAEIEVNGPITVKYTWLRSDGGTAPEKTVEFNEAGTKKVNTSWTLGESGKSYEGNWQQLKIISPKEILSNKAEFDLQCDEETVNIAASLTVVGENEFTGACPKEFDFEAEIEVDGAVTLMYTWLRSDGATGPEFTLEFEEAGTQMVKTSWRLGESGESYENFWQQLKIIAPQEILSNKADFDLNCVAEESIELVSLNPTSPNELYVGDNVEFKFNYSTSEPSGVRIFGRPFTDGTITPGYSAHPSEINPTGEGTNTGFFTIQENPIHVDQIRFQMWDADQNNLLHEYFVEVDYNFIAHTVELTSADPESSAILCLNDRLEFTFNYKTNEPTGVRIFGRPFTGGSPTLGYGAHGSPLHATGEGSGNGYFTLTNSPNTVDQIRFQMWDADQSNLLFEYFVDVEYEFSPHCISLTSINPDSPATLSKEERINFSFDYKTTETTGVRIFGRPFTDGNITQGYAAHGSPINPTGEGSNTGFFTLKSAGKVDQIRFQIWDADQNNLLREYYVDVEYEFTD